MSHFMVTLVSLACMFVSHEGKPGVSEQERGTQEVRAYLS